MQAKNGLHDCRWQNFTAPAPTITPGMSVEACGGREYTIVDLLSRPSQSGFSKRQGKIP
jgi:hypothetical protein